MKDRGARAWVNGLVILILLLLSLFLVFQASPAVGEASGSPEEAQSLIPAIPLGQAMAGPVPVSITERGFEPEVVTVTVGTIVEWTNLTSETVHLVGVAQDRICLLAISGTVGTQIQPLVRRRQGHDYRSSEAKSMKRNDHNEAPDVLATSHLEEPLG